MTHNIVLNAVSEARGILPKDIRDQFRITIRTVWEPRLSTVAMLSHRVTGERFVIGAFKDEGTNLIKTYWCAELDTDSAEGNFSDLETAKTNATNWMQEIAL